MSTQQATILLVDDSATDRQQAAILLQQKTGFSLLHATDSETALAAIDRQLVDAVLVDPAMPAETGLRLVKSIRGSTPHIPVVVIAAKGEEAAAISALRCGAASYVPKHLLSEHLCDTLRAVLRVSRQERHLLRMLERMTELRCGFALENDPALIGPMVGYLQEHMSRLQVCDETETTRFGIALHEALTNSMFHGNLELGSLLREQGNAFEQQLVQRAGKPPYSQRHVHIEAYITADSANITVRDEGPGFDPGTLPDPTDPENVEKITGRGIFLIRTFMDEVRFNESGNAITMRKDRLNAVQPQKAVAEPGE